MSGHFRYQQSVLDEIADSIRKLIEENDTHGQYNETTIAEFQKAHCTLKLASVLTQRIDWLVSGDDGESTFHERLASDLKELSEQSIPTVS